MYSRSWRLARSTAVVVMALAVAAPLRAGIQPPAAGTIAPSAKSQNGKYVVTLRPLPAEGLYAGEDTDLEFFVGDASRDDPIFGPAPVIRAQIRGRFTMPAMP